MRKRLLAALLATLMLVLAIAPGLAEEKPAFTVLTVRWTDTWPIEFLKTGAMKELEDNANVDITWDVRYNADWSE